MSVRPHPTKHRRYKGQTWWIIDVCNGKDRERIPFEGSFQAASEINKDLLQGSTGHVQSVAPTIKEIILPFLAWYKNEVADSTLEDVNDTISIYLVPHFGNFKPGQLTISTVNDFKTKLLEKGLKPTTINKHLNYFSSLLKWAVAHEHCKQLTFALPRFPKKKTVSEPVRPLSQRQLDAVYEHIQSHYRLSFLLMADQGLRLDEALNLKVGDVDEEHQIIIVKGKGNKYRRVPYLSDRFEDELTKVLDNRIDGFLVVNPKTGIPYVTIRKELNRAAKSAGLERSMNHHLLRHTCATLCAEKGMNPHALQRILGHASIETTNKIYTNVSRDFVGDEARRMREKTGNK